MGLANTVRFHCQMPAPRPRLSHLPAVAALGCLLMAAALAQGANEGRFDEIQLQASASRAGPRAKSTLRHLPPSFNSEGLWQDVGLVDAGDPAARLSRWRDVMAKARAEGFH